MDITAAGATWALGEALGGILSGAGTDPGTGSLLILLALACWPTRAGRAAGLTRGR